MHQQDEAQHSFAANPDAAALVAVAAKKGTPQVHLYCTSS